MDDDALTRRMVVSLLLGALVGALAWLARTLSAADDLPPLRRLVGGVLGSCIATLSIGALAIEYLGASPLLLVGIAGPIGWLGGDSLILLARFILKQRV